MANTAMTPELLKAMRGFKSRLTRAKNLKDWAAILIVTDDLRKYFEARDLPLPDNYNLWAVAALDAEFEIRRALLTKAYGGRVTR